MMATPLTEGYERRSKQMVERLEKIGREDIRRKELKRTTGNQGEGGKRVRGESLTKVDQIKVGAPLIGLRKTHK